MADKKYEPEYRKMGSDTPQKAKSTALWLLWLFAFIFMLLFIRPFLGMIGL